jgi:hypothetical protein
MDLNTSDLSSLDCSSSNGTPQRYERLVLATSDLEQPDERPVKYRDLLNTSELSEDDCYAFTNQKTSTPISECLSSELPQCEADFSIFSEEATSTITTESELGCWPMGDSSCDEELPQSK